MKPGTPVGFSPNLFEKKILEFVSVRRVDVIYSDIVLLPPDVVVPLPFLPLCLETQGADDLLDDGVDMRQWCKDVGPLTLSKTMV